MRAAAATLLLAVLVSVLISGGCAPAPPRAAAPAPAAVAPAAKPPVPCLSQADDRLFATCLQAELTAIWSQDFLRTGRTYTPPRLTVGDGPDAQGGHPQDGGPDRAFYQPRTGIHFPTQYLNAVHAAHGPLARVALTFTMAHETGHHIQFLLHPQVHAPVHDQEAQADCYAGVWARGEADIGRLDPGQFRAASAAELGRLSTYPDETASHGTPDQRLASLDKGLHSGDPAACDVGQLTWR